MTLKPKYICSKCGNYMDNNYSSQIGGAGCFTNIVFILGIITGLFFLFSIPILTIILLIFLAILKNCIQFKKNIYVCPFCKDENTILPINTPNGQIKFNEFYPNWKTEDGIIYEIKKKVDSQEQKKFICIILIIIGIIAVLLIYAFL